MKMQLIRQAEGGFWPARENDWDALEHVKTGGVIYGDARQPRNPHPPVLSMIVTAFLVGALVGYAL